MTTIDMMFEQELRAAVGLLPGDLRVWMSRALESGWFSITAGSYENGGPGGTVCPIAAAAKLAGAWVDGGIKGHDRWGTSEGPSPEVEDFAAYFDLCAEEVGLDRAIAIVSEAIAASARVTREAA